MAQGGEVYLRVVRCDSEWCIFACNALSNIECFLERQVTVNFRQDGASQPREENIISKDGGRY